MNNVRLIAITRPDIENINTTEDFIAYVARVSNPSNQMNTETSGKLLKYLLRNKHYSPFEMASMTLEINTTRDIARQILRHRSFSFQEFSQRYASVESLGFIVREARLQDIKNRQNSFDLPQDSKLAYGWESRQEEILELVKEYYAWALDNGIAKEQSRAVLPEGMTKSRMYMAGSIRSWIHYCEIRADNATQKEHREIAVLCKELLMKELPSLSEVL